MKRRIGFFLFLLMSISLGLVIGLVASDAIQFSRLINGEYKTPWYSNSWLEQPFTTAFLRLQPSIELDTNNSNKTEAWKIRVVQINGTFFWTVLERKPLVDVPK